MSEVYAETTALLEGDVRIDGRIMPASNATFFGSVVEGDSSIRCVYKPVAGERPLWDFPDGSLAGREVAAYLISEALGWDVVPPTVLRDGPAGSGMVQAWKEPDPDQDPVDLVLGAGSSRGVPEGYLHVLDALDERDRPVALVHEDSAPLRRMAVFDVLVNNADRKGGHVLPMVDGHRYGVDHGVCFHVEDKLRTVLWGWASRPLDPTDLPALELLAEALANHGSVVRCDLAEHITGSEIRALTARLAGLLARRRMPLPSGGWPSIPWPAF
ncbi:MAG: SCO1664 family protein [Nocardioides sp.]